MKRILTAFAAAGLLAVPTSAQAQVVGNYCAPGQGWCFSLNEFSFTELVGTPGASLYQGTVQGTFTGGAFSGLTGLRAWVMLSATPYTYPMQPGVQGAYTVESVGAPGLPLSSWNYTDIGIGWQSTSGVAASGSCGRLITGPPSVTGGPCDFSVPEPGTHLLLLTGLMSLVLIAWRRREETLA